VIRFLIIVPLIIIALIVAISLYLQPNDLAKCGELPSVAGTCEPVDAIVAVSGGDTNARTDEAIALYKNQWAETIIFAGAAQDKSGPSNAAAMKSRAIAAGVPEASIVLDEASANTRENAVNTEEILKNLSVNKIILVTSGYHQRRAGLEFARTSPDVTIINHPVSSDQDWSFWWWTGPRGWTLAASELVKIGIFYVESARG